MTEAEARDKLVELAAGNPTVDIAVVADPPVSDDGAQVIAPDIQTLNLSGDAETAFRKILRRSVGRLDREKMRAVEYSATYLPLDDEFEWAALADMPGVRAALGLFANLNPYAAFLGAEDFKKRLKYYVGVYGVADDEPVYTFRVFRPSNEIKKKRGSALMLRDGVYSRLEEQIFLFDDYVDCIVWDDFVFVVNKRNFRAIFGEFDEVERRATEAADALHLRVPIEGLADFKALLASQPQMADKMIAVSGRPYFATLSVEALQPIIDEFHLDIEVTADGNGAKQLKFDPGITTRWRILKLLDDDYLRSVLANDHYEVTSKRSLG